MQTKVSLLTARTLRQLKPKVAVLQNRLTQQEKAILSRAGQIQKMLQQQMLQILQTSHHQKLYMQFGKRRQAWKLRKNRSKSKTRRT